VFLLQLLQLPYLVALQPHVLLLPSIEGLLSDPHLPTHLHHPQARLGLLKNCHNLFYGKLLPLHGKSPFLTAQILPETNSQHASENGGPLNPGVLTYDWGKNGEQVTCLADSIFQRASTRRASIQKAKLP